MTATRGTEAAPPGLATRWIEEYIRSYRREFDAPAEVLKGRVRRGFFAGVCWTVGGATSVSVPAGFNELFVVECERRA